jgi:hypothetical protein
MGASSEVWRKRREKCLPFVLTIFEVQKKMIVNWNLK